MNRQPTALQVSMAALFGVYMSKQGADGKLTKQDFLELLNEQMPAFKKGGADIGEEVFEGVDMNDDGKVDFKEFAMMTAGFAAANFEVLQEVMKEQGN